MKGEWGYQVSPGITGWRRLCLGCYRLVYLPSDNTHAPDCRTAAYEAAYEGMWDALIWCSGASDFAPEGKAREGWERVVKPALAAADALEEP